jgi:hypothetical protein
MTLVLRKTSANTIKWPIMVKKPCDGGSFKEVKFTAIFKEIGRDEFNSLVEEGDVALTDMVLLGWEDVQDEEGIDVPFNEENKKALLNDFTVIKSVIQTYGNMIMGGAEKN